MTTYNECEHVSNSLNERNDCTVKALAITTSIGYSRAHKIMGIMGRRKGRGLYCKGGPLDTVKRMSIAARLAGRIVDSPDYPQGYTMSSIGVRYPHGNYLIFTSGHVAALVNGTVQDWTKGRRHRVKYVIKVGV